MKSIHLKTSGVIIFTSALVIFILACNKKPLREKSQKYNPVAPSTHIPLTVPTCAPGTTNVVFKKSGSTVLTQGITSKLNVTNSNGYRVWELRPTAGNQFFCRFEFTNLRTKISANYQCISRFTSVAARGVNTFASWGQISISGNSGYYDTDKSGVCHVQYKSSTNTYLITLCDVPVTFKYNASSALEHLTMTMQFESQ